MPDTSNDLDARLTNARDHLGSALRPSAPPFDSIRRRAAHRRTQGVAVAFFSLALVALGSIVAVSTLRDGGERVGTYAEEPAPSGPVVSDPVPPAAGEPEVTAAELWSATIDGLDCIDAVGVGTTGPWPDTSGSGVHYEVVVSRGGDMAQAEAASEDCLSESETLARAFALQESTSEQEVLQQVRTALLGCLAEGGVTIDSDLELATAAQEHTAEFRDCARQVTP